MGVGIEVAGQLVGSGLPVQSESRQTHSAGPSLPLASPYSQLSGDVQAQPIYPPSSLVGQRTFTVGSSQ